MSQAHLKTQYEVTLIGSKDRCTHFYDLPVSVETENCWIMLFERQVRICATFVLLFSSFVILSLLGAALERFGLETKNFPFAFIIKSWQSRDIHVMIFNK